MKTPLSNHRERGLTRIELFVILAVCTLFAILVVPALLRAKTRAERISCVSYLKQIGLSYRVWEGDHKGEYPTQVSQTNGGTMEFTSGSDAFRHLQIMSNELSTPRILICPADSDRARFWSTNFSTLNNSNLSYFVGLDANETNPQGILAGDRNLTNGTPVRNGILELSATNPTGWTEEMHNRVGNIALADGSVQQVSRTGLQVAVTNAGSFTSRLQMPILSP